MRPRIALGRYDRTEPLLCRRLASADRLEFVEADTDAATWGILEGRYDAGEMSLATFVKAVDDGQDLVGLPIVTHRKFFHQYVFVRRGSGIHRLEDLRGRRLLVPMYWMTSSIWHRAILEDEAGIGFADVEWRVLRADRLPTMRIPPGAPVERLEASSWVEPLLDGRCDALMAAATTPDMVAVRDRLERPFPDFREAQRAFFRRVGFFPPVHVLVCRRSSLGKEWLGDLGECIAEAKRLAYRQLQNEAFTSLPLIREALDDSRRLFGDDPYPDGLAANRRGLEAFLGACARQGLTSRALTVEDCFVDPGEPSSREAS